MSEQYRENFEGLRRFAPAAWSTIPDLGLYMDQVITFIGRVYEPVYGEDVKQFLSAPMINNYVKSRLIPRPTGKKYSREQIALLTMIVALKQVCSMEEIRRMLTPMEGETVEALYGAFCARYSRVMRTLQPEEGAEPASALDLALDLAIRASGYHAGCIAALKADAASKES